jgi:hypothetical protein
MTLLASARTAGFLLQATPSWPPVGRPRDEALFAQARVNPDTGTIEWPNGADLNPLILHDWPEYRERIVAERRARHTVAT